MSKQAMEMALDALEMPSARNLAEAATRNISICEAIAALKEAIKQSQESTYSPAFKCIGVIDSEGNIYPESPEAGTQVFVSEYTTGTASQRPIGYVRSYAIETLREHGHTVIDAEPKAPDDIPLYAYAHSYKGEQK